MDILPGDIERRSFEIIGQEMSTQPDELHAPIIKRVIHTTADFDYEQNLLFSEKAVQAGLEALRNGASIVTDTNMALSGINKAALGKLGCSAVCYMADADIAEAAKLNGSTRAVASMNKAAELEGDVIFALGNAPTALLRLLELAEAGRVQPRLVIGCPVGFVNVVESKELLLQSGLEYIVARGRKGGSNVAAAICNALLYMITRSGV